MGAKLTFQATPIAPDRTFIVTGGNAGLGYATAKGLAQLGGRVIIACRSEERATKAIEQMRKEHLEEALQQSKAQKTEGATDTSQAAEGASNAASVDSSKPLNVEFMKLDLSSFASTMEFINAYKAKGYPLHVLICNAGYIPTKQEFTADGNEVQFQVNYLAQHLIILHLLPLLRASAPNSRIVFVTGSAFTFKYYSSFKADDLQLKNSYSGAKAGGNSKLFQMMSMYALDRRLPAGCGVGVFALHPGTLVSTNITSNLNKRSIENLSMKAATALHMSRTPRDGAAVILKAAADPEFNGKSAVFMNASQKVDDPGAVPKNIEKQEVLWKYSLECLKDYITDDVTKDFVEPAGKGTQNQEAVSAGKQEPAANQEPAAK